MILNEHEGVVRQQHDEQVVQLVGCGLCGVPLERPQGVSVDGRGFELGPFQCLPEPRLSRIAKGLHLLRPLFIRLLKFSRKPNGLHGLNVDELHAVLSTSIRLAPRLLYLNDLVVCVSQRLVRLRPELIDRFGQLHSMLLRQLQSLSQRHQLALHRLQLGSHCFVCSVPRKGPTVDQAPLPR